MARGNEVMHKKDLKKLALLFPIVFLAGCIQLGGGGAGTGPGLSINSFSPSDTQVEPGTTVVLTLILENRGNSIARNIRIELGGLTDDWQIDGRSRSIPDLDKADPSRGVNTAPRDTLDWTLVPPGLSNKLDYQAVAQVTYDYSTTLDTLIRATSQDYWRTNKPKTGVIGPSNVATGPISVTVKAPNSVFAGSSVPVYFEFHNTASGRVVGPAIDTVNVQISGSGISCQKSQVKLIQGKDGFLRCDASTGGVSTFKDFRVSMTASYAYQLTSITTISVLPRAG
ncbi:MAG TPA: hypothetical protein VJJ76_03205 [archaeon]|nr:hypothetical protein [archaeon]